MSNEIEQELLNTWRPDLPPSLRQRILRTASQLVQPHESRLDVMWFSQRWRVTAVLMFFGLVAADVLSSAADRLASRLDGPPVQSSVIVATQAAIDAGLGKADVAAIAAQASLPLMDQSDARETGGALEFTGARE
jgi:hypothetical protein